MILQLIVDNILNMLIYFVNLMPITTQCAFDGIDSAIGWFGYIVSATSIIVPWGDIWIMMEITIAVSLAQISVQIVKFMASRSS